MSGDCGEWKLSQMLFADDAALVVDIEGKFCCLVIEFGSACDLEKLHVNVGKNKMMKS